VETSELEARFHEVLLQRHQVLEKLDAAAALDSILRWYEDERVDDAVALDDDGDMVLLQWGTYDWGRGQWFEYDITRQVIQRHADGDDAIWQLSLTLRFAPNEETDRLGEANRWCSLPAEVDAMRAFAHASQSAIANAQLAIDHVEVSLENAG
jgi:hypothetical protein